MSWFTVIALVIVVTSVMSVSKYLRRLVSLLAVVFCTGLLVHYQTSPVESLTSMAVLGAGLGLTRPLRWLLKIRVI